MPENPDTEAQTRHTAWEHPEEHAPQGHIPQGPGPNQSWESSERPPGPNPPGHPCVAISFSPGEAEGIVAQDPPTPTPENTPRTGSSPGPAGLPVQLCPKENIRFLLYLDSCRVSDAQERTSHHGVGSVVIRATGPLMGVGQGQSCIPG